VRHSVPPSGPVSLLIEKPGSGNGDRFRKVGPAGILKNNRSCLHPPLRCAARNGKGGYHPPVLRRLFTLVSALSLVLCVATCVMWVRSYRAQFAKLGNPPFLVLCVSACGCAAHSSSHPAAPRSDLQAVQALSGAGIADPQTSTDQNPVARLPDSGGEIVQFSDDGKRLLTAGPSAARVWDAVTFKPLTKQIRQGGGIRTAALSPDGRHVLTVATNEVWVWDVDSGKRVRVLVHGKEVSSATFSPDGSKVLTSGADKACRLWDAGSGELLLNLEHRTEVPFSGFSPDGGAILTVSPAGDEEHRSAFLWDAATGRRLWALWIDGPWLQAPVFSRDGKRVGLFDSNAIRIIDSRSGKVLTRIELEDRNIGPASSAAFSPDAGKILAVSAGGLVHLWRTDHDDPPIRELAVQTGARSAAFSLDGRWILIAGARGVSGLWDFATARQVLPIPDGYAVPSVAFSPDGRHFAATYSTFPVGSQTTVWAVPPTQ
jgi:dipeptidyl aminopeptidase/acylaminoacyl peptidase